MQHKRCSARPVLGGYLRQSFCRTYVLGVSGGVYSLAAGLLAQAAVSKLGAEGYPAGFVAIRLPYGVHADESDVQKSLAVIRSDRVITIDIKPAGDTLLAALMLAEADGVEPARKDFQLGNRKARQRMIAQSAWAGATGGLVIGTD